MSAPSLLPPTYLIRVGEPFPDPGLSFVSADFPVTFQRSAAPRDAGRAMATIGLIRYYPCNGHVMVAHYAGTNADDHQELLDIGVVIQEDPPSDRMLDHGWDEIIDDVGRRALQIEHNAVWPLARVMEVLEDA